MCILSSISAAEFSNGGQLYFSEFNFGTFRLQGNPAFFRGTIKAMIDRIIIDPNHNGVVEAYNNHSIPFANEFFGVISQIENSTFLALNDQHGLRRAPDMLHISRCGAHDAAVPCRRRVAQT